ncbi:iron-containing alcohol dehydrogenase [Paenibacillus harenae]|uniref:Alcohol dehydrogenase YqhD (Iron-dependent ADH family) n=1 Tax=Paenibacillus harenae TaxID=306543 RepID=A0ABT9TWZ2_PAEHA|nr:iron-containing alcohol dehydrogenase [Paenibacillus harenae]MDQ0111862.1 alcohol dehydrogenase YqhD (iron-dependent ADH family) [Paenibacillus harenae]
MNAFQFYNPTSIVFGEGTADRVGELTARYGKNVLFVYGSGSIKKTGLHARTLSRLAEAGITVHELPNIEPNPRLTTVNKGIALCREHGIDFILAVGGGSVIDASKAIAAGTLYEGDVWDFYSRKAVVQQALPIGTILTLAATGSEMNGGTVVTNWEENQKQSFVSPHTYPVFSILDPTLTYTVPRNHTVYGSVDIMSHVFEQYFSLTPNTPLQERFCESILQTVIENVEIAIAKPDDAAARANLMWCGTMALNGGQISVGMENDWSSHGIEHEVSAIYDIPHGAGLAVLFPNWMKYVYKQRVDRFVQFAQRVWGISGEGMSDDEIALAGIQATRDFFTRIGAESRLADFGIGEENLDRMAEEAVKYGNIGSFKPLGKDDVHAILTLSL